MKITYGIIDTNIDVTEICLNKLLNNDIITIPSNDFTRANVFTDPIIGVKNTRLGIMAFLYGLTGLTLATYGMRFFMVVDWPMNIGGKPNFTYLDNMLAFIPVTFEFTVLCAAHGMAITYLLRNKTLPGIPAQNPDPRTTDDRFVIEIRMSENHKVSEEAIDKLLTETGYVEIDKKEIK